MKKVTLLFALLVLGAAFLLSGTSLKDVGAQGRSDDPGNSAAHRQDGRVVAPDGVVFESHKAFIDAGRRCSTRHVDDLEMEEVDAQVRGHRATGGRSTGGGGSSTDAARLYPSGSVLIPVYFHVVYRSDGTGNISDTWLANQ